MKEAEQGRAFELLVNLGQSPPAGRRIRAELTGPENTVLRAQSRGWQEVKPHTVQLDGRVIPNDAPCGDYLVTQLESVQTAGPELPWPISFQPGSGIRVIPPKPSKPPALRAVSIE